RTAPFPWARSCSAVKVRDPLATRQRAEASRMRTSASYALDEFGTRPTELREPCCRTVPRPRHQELEMPMPTDVGAIDLMISFPPAAHAGTYDYLRPMLRDAGSAGMEMPAEYMFKDIPNRLEDGEDPVAITLGEMDRWGVDIGLVGIGRDVTLRALRDH